MYTAILCGLGAQMKDTNTGLGRFALMGELFDTPRLTANQRPIRSHWETPFLCDRIASPLRPGWWMGSSLQLTT